MKRTPAEIVRCYQMLTEVQRSAPDDVAVLEGIGRAPLTGREPLEALKAFEMVLRLRPNSATSEEDAGSPVWNPVRRRGPLRTWSGPWNLDPLLLSGGTALREVYPKGGGQR